MELRTYLAILWRRKWVIAVTLVVTVTVVVIGTLMATPKYVASTTLRVLTATGGSVDWVEYHVMYADRLMNTYAQIATSGPVLEELVLKLSLDGPPQIEVEVLANTELMQITVEDPNPILAREAANALAEILVTQSRELYTGGGRTAQEILSEQLAQIEDESNQARREYESLVTQSPEDSERIAAASRSVELKQETYAMLLEQYERARVTEAIRANVLSVVEPAVVPQAPSKPRQALNIALGFMVGLAGGIGLAFLFENLDTTLHTTEQIEEVTELPTLGEISTARRQRQIAFFNGNSPQGEAFRRLRTNIFALSFSVRDTTVAPDMAFRRLPTDIFGLDHDPPLQTLLVTSAEPKEGKSTIVANLAFAIAQSGRKVIVVDGDLRRPILHKIFDLSNEIGLSSILRQEVTLDEAAQDSKIPGVQVLTSGPLPPDPAELLGSPQMSALIEQLTQQFDMILLDTPAFPAVADVAVLAPSVDGVVLVVGRAQARGEAVRAARQQLTNVKARLVGVVVNRAKQDSSHRYYKYHQQTKIAQVRDPLAEIYGIGPVYEKALNALGILTFAQLAEQDPEELAGKIRAYVTVKRIYRDRWTEQAQTLIHLENHDRSLSDENSPKPG
jgi:succinoglycan biosynthesis transport protein ExoP